MSRSTSKAVLSLSLAATTVSGLAAPQKNASTRRDFVARVPALVGSSVAFGWFANMEGHDANCQCGGCTSGHAANCQCGNCGISYGPPAASAYERDVGGTDRSATTAAFNAQAKQTNARLEKDGFKLDSKEEESARLADAMASFSYESSTGTKQSGKGYGNAKKTESKK